MFPIHSFEIKKLDEGDYCSGKVLVERKKIGDLNSSYKSGRLHNQLSRLTAHHCDKVVIVLITGSVEEFANSERKKGRQVSKETIHRVVASLLVRDDIRVIWNYHHENGLREMVHIMEAVAANKLDISHTQNHDMLLARFLGVTPSQWTSITKVHGTSICHFCTMTKKDWMKVRGLPVKKIESIMNTLKNGWE